MQVRAKPQNSCHAARIASPRRGTRDAGHEQLTNPPWQGREKGQRWSPRPRLTLHTGACVLSARLARARESVNLPFEATGVTPQFPRLRRRSRRGTSQRRSAWTPHGNATHTGRKLHLWFTPQAKAARPARTAKTRDSAHNVPFRSTELRVRPATFRPRHTRTGLPVRHPDNSTRGPAPRRPAA
jgi:hypothetical protein